MGIKVKPATFVFLLGSPFSVRPLSWTPSDIFFRTTFFTSSRAWGARGMLKQVLCNAIPTIINKAAWENMTLSLTCSLCSCVCKQVLKKTALTWKKLSSLSFRMPSLSRSDILKMQVSALMQEGFIWRINRKEHITCLNILMFFFVI